MNHGVVFLIGLLIGRILNLIIIRMSRGEGFSGGPAPSPRTGHHLKLWRMLPVVGWMLQGGEGEEKGQRLRWLYPLVEILTASTLVVLFWAYQLSPLFFYLSVVCSLLIINGAIDWKHKVVYHVLSLVPAALFIFISPLIPGHSLRESVLGMLVSGTIFVVFFFLARLMFPTKAVPFGLGDVFLGLFIGAAFGLNRLVTTLSYGIFLAGLAAIPLLIARRVLRRQDVSEFMPYGTYLCLGAMLALFLHGWW